VITLGDSERAEGGGNQFMIEASDESSGVFVGNRLTITVHGVGEIEDIFLMLRPRSVAWLNEPFAVLANI